MDHEEYMRKWTDEQWADSEQVMSEAAAMLGDDGDVGSLTVLVIEERKIDPNTTVKCAASLAITLGAETMLQLRHAARGSRKGGAPAVLRKPRPKRAKVAGV